MNKMNEILRVENLNVTFKRKKANIQAVRGTSFFVTEGETLAIVGESGSGKSVTAKSIMGMIPKSTSLVTDGKIMFKGKSLLESSKKELEHIRGSEIGMIFQDPMTALNPTMKIGKQIDEVLIKNKKVSRKEAKEQTINLLKMVGISDPSKRYSEYPHEFSGGMRQRVVIAMAIACNPSLIIADEPTTALDVTIQAQILNLLETIQEKNRSSIILITHDLGVVAEVADRVAVMYGGMIVESGKVEDIFERPKHPYTWGLLQSVPKLTSEKKERLVPIEGAPPDLADPPLGCAFAPRCPYAMGVCIEHLPDEEFFSADHVSRCWLNDERAPKPHSLKAPGREQYV